MRRIAWCGLLLLALLPAVSAQDAPAPRGGAARALEEATRAYEERDLEGFLRHTREAHALDPTDPLIAYNFACALALNGQAAAAVEVLGQIANWPEINRVYTDKDFDEIRNTRGFREFLGRLGTARTRQPSSGTGTFSPVVAPRGDEAPRPAAAPLVAPVLGGEFAFAVPGAHLEPRHIAWDPVDQLFFLTSPRLRKIVAVDAGGRTRDVIGAGQDGFWGGGGIEVDAARRILWAASSVVPRMQGFAAEDDGKAALFAYSLETGRLLRRFVIDDTRRHRLEEIAVRKDGTVFVADSRAGTVYRVSALQGPVEAFFPFDQFREPAGLALTPDGTRLLVADAEGIQAIDIAARVRARLPHPVGTSLRGISSMAASGRSILAVQPGERRVVQLWLDRDLERIERVVPIHADDPGYGGAPAGLALVEQDLFFIANSTTEENSEAAIVLKAPVPGPPRRDQRSVRERGGRDDAS